MKVFHTCEKSDHDPLKAWDPDLKRHSVLYMLWVYTVPCTRNLSGIQISFSALKILCVCVCVCVCVWVAQSCLTLCDPKDCTLPGSSDHGILQARRLEWVGILFSRGSSWPRDWLGSPALAGRFFTLWATRDAPQIPCVSSIYPSQPPHPAPSSH